MRSADGLAFRTFDTLRPVKAPVLQDSGLSFTDTASTPPLTRLTRDNHKRAYNRQNPTVIAFLSAESRRS